MKLLKLSEEHYIVADKCKLDIKVGDWITDKYSVWQWKDDSSLLGRLKVTHSSEPLRIIHGDNNEETVYYGYLPIYEVKKLIGVVDVEKKAYLAAQKRYRLEHIPLEQIDEYGGEVKEFVKNFIVTYNQALEDNKEKKYTEDDMGKIFYVGVQLGINQELYTQLGKPLQNEEEVLDRTIKSLQPKTEWDVEFVDGKLKLIQ